jgi:hypothetical protein
MDGQEEIGMGRIFVSLFLGCSAALIAGNAMAQSCYDLWYERNAIYDANGYCFSSQLGMDTFDNSDCWTDSPNFSRAEQRRIDQLRRQERSRGCRVNN